MREASPNVEAKKRERLLWLEKNFLSSRRGVFRFEKPRKKGERLKKAEAKKMAARLLSIKKAGRKAMMQKYRSDTKSRIWATKCGFYGYKTAGSSRDQNKFVVFFRGSAAFSWAVLTET